MANLLRSVAGAVIGNAVKTAASVAKEKRGSEKSKASASDGAEGVTSRYDRQLMSEEDLTAVQRYSAAAKTASAAGDRAGVAAAHDAAEALRAKYGYSGGQFGDRYVPLEEKPAVTAPKADVDGMRDTLRQAAEAAGQRQEQRIDYETAQGIAALKQAQQEAEGQFQALRDQTDVDERKALDNQALYAEVRGDRGGVGREQYGAVQSGAARNRLTVNRQQTELGTQTRLQMEQLRNQGEFEKADALLALSQTYLTELAGLEKWAAEYGLDTARFQTELDRWKQEFQLKAGELLGNYGGAATLAAQKHGAALEQERQKLLADAGTALLKAGIRPSAAQLAAMGMTAAQAAAQLSAQTAKRTASKTASGGRQTSDGKQDYEGLFQAARDSVDGKSFVANNYRRFGFSAATGLWDAYQNWLVKKEDNTAVQLDFDPDEGIFTWNGKRYNSLQKLLQALWAEELTDREKAELESKLFLWGYDVALS